MDASVASTPPRQGAIRMLLDPPADLPAPLAFWWHHDRSLREWITEIGRLHQMLVDVSGDTLLSAIPEPYEDPAQTPIPLTEIGGDPVLVATSTDLFYANQRARWLAFKTLNRWRTRVWRRSPQCGVDLIENTPVNPADAIYLTDTRNRTVFCFHHRDLFSNFMAKITASEEMLPSPRPPTNPWTNEPLTLPQILSVCEAIVQRYAARGRCPPPLFAAFCAARYDLRRFEAENTAMLAQHAITAYFKDLHEHNRETVIDTALELLRDATTRYSAVSFRRWMRQTPVTPIHREWLALVRDYTLSLNLHIQPRRHWHTEDGLYSDVRRLLHRTPLTDPTGPRLRMLRTVGPPPATPLMPAAASPLSLALMHLTTTMGPAPILPLNPGPFTLFTPIQPPTGAQDASGGTVAVTAPDASGGTPNDEDIATAALLMLFQHTLDGGFDFPGSNPPPQ
jgi:hypothetical protein